jgi:acetoacetyl-CoA synthetase
MTSSSVTISAPVGDTPLWMPDPARSSTSHLAHFIEHLHRRGYPLPLSHDHNAFTSLHAWSVDHPARFWSEFWRFRGVVAENVAPAGTQWLEVLRGGDRMAPPDEAIGPWWFDGARLNIAENMLQRHDEGDAIVAWDERGRYASRSWTELQQEVAQVAAALRALGVGPGDRVAGWLPNIPEAVVAMLATAALGAVWTSCSPDFGNDGIVDRFGQTEPSVLFFCDGYGYGGKTHACNDRAIPLLDRLPTVRHAVMIAYRGDGVAPADPRITSYRELLRDSDAPPQYQRVPFSHPLYVLYSSGTTGLPKCIVHSAGGAFLQLLKEHLLHVDIRRNERLFYFTTCGWMMWNWQVNALAAGATIVLYDGAPLPVAEPDILWRLAAIEKVDVFGTSAKYLALTEKAGLAPGARHDLSALRTVLSTGSPLAPESFEWISRSVSRRVQTASISGGTDIVSCFVLGNPFSPVYSGEIQGPGLGIAVEVFREDGTPASEGEAGELVCTRPFPSMPIGFWNDADGAKYRAAYFDHYPGVWRHGDWVMRTEHDGFVISGRSDATLNPGGVRIGTAEIYRQVETIDAVVESLVIGQRIVVDGTPDDRVVLFVRLREGTTLDDALRTVIRQRIRTGTSPHHVPRVIAQVADIPRTRSGKLSELAVRDVVEGRPVKNVGALANPDSLALFRDLPELS